MHEYAAKRRDATNSVFDRIGAFLVAQGLSPDPANYSFAHSVITNPRSPLATAVAQLTEGGIRLTRQDLEALGGPVASGPPTTATPVPANAPPSPDAKAEKLVAETEAHVAGFADMMRTIQEQTSDFGRDLAKSAAAISRAPGLAGVAGMDEIARITGAMVARVRDAETRLAHATSETDTLRAKLAEAQDSARRDPLTGLPNRRAFAEALAARPAPAGGRADCVALCDIDRFKQINDQFGHAVGDRVLSAIARTLTEVCEGHLVVRHGGEEFAILMLGVDLSEAAALLDRTRAAVGSKRFRSRETNEPLGTITVSAGVTALHIGEAPDDALARADRLLYVAKADGRDRICAG